MSDATMNGEKKVKTMALSSFFLSLSTIDIKMLNQTFLRSYTEKVFFSFLYSIGFESYKEKEDYFKHRLGILCLSVLFQNVLDHGVSPQLEDV